jgi:stearoyl-CoA desaturase (delta-9 desaturase)
LSTAIRRGERERVSWRTSMPFFLCHLIPLAAIFTGVTTEAVVLGVVLYVARMFFITVGYHRYFAHRTYRMARLPQFLLAFGGTTAVQQGPLWWAANHRDHHRYADTDRDPHTPQKGFWWSHVGWVLAPAYKQVDYATISEFSKYPELRFIDRHDWIGPWALGLASFLIAGWSGLVIGFFASTVVLWHATFLVNSVAHVFGYRRYATADTSRNSAIVAVLTMGEGWHNNHHHYPASARLGFRWWELDMGFGLLRALSWVGVVKDLRQPPQKAREARRLRRGALDVGSLRLHLNRAAATLERVRESRTGTEVDGLKRALAEIGERAGRVRPQASSAGSG